MNFFRFFCFFLAALLAGSGSAVAYDPDRHSVLTELAVEQFNRCVELDANNAYSELGYLIDDSSKNILIRSNREEDGWTLERALNWHFYNPQVEEYAIIRRTIGIFSRSLKRIFQCHLRKLESSNSPDKLYSILGQEMHYIEDVTNPSHSVPVFHGKGDKIDYLPIDALRFKEEAIQLTFKKCKEFSQALPNPGNIDDVWKLLEDTSQATRDALKQPVCEGETKKWEYFWLAPPAGYIFLLRSKYFGKYVGTEKGFFRTKEVDWFGDTTRLNTSACSDQGTNPEELYKKFVFQRHLEAVQADVKLLFWAARTIADRAENPVSTRLAATQPAPLPKLLTGNHKALPLTEQTGFYMQQLFVGAEAFSIPGRTEQDSKTLLGQLLTVSELLEQNLTKISKNEKKRSVSPALKAYADTAELLQKAADSHAIGAEAMKTWHDALTAMDRMTDKATGRNTAVEKELIGEDIQQKLMLAEAQLLAFVESSKDLEVQVDKMQQARSTAAEAQKELQQLDEILTAVQQAIPEDLPLD